MVAYPFPSAATEALVDSSTERLRRLYPISTPKDDTSEQFVERAETQWNKFRVVAVVSSRHRSPIILCLPASHGFVRQQSNLMEGERPLVEQDNEADRKIPR